MILTTSLTIIGAKQMPKYLVSYTETNIYSIEVEAGDEELAEQVADNILSKDGIFKFNHVGIDSFFQVEGVA